MIRVRPPSGRGASTRQEPPLHDIGCHTGPPRRLHPRRGRGRGDAQRLRPHHPPAGEQRLRRQRDPGARGPRGSAQAPRHVHRVHGTARSAPPGERDRRQLRRRGPRRVRQRHPDHHAQGRRDPRRRRRPRHPGRHPPRRGDLHGRARPHQAARRRQVRRRRIRGVRRPARRRQLRRERAVRAPRRRGPPPGRRVAPELHHRRAGRTSPEGRGIPRDRHDHHLLAEPRDLRDRRVRLRHPPRALPADGVPQQGPGAHAARRARGGRRRAPHREGSSTSGASSTTWSTW